MSTVANATSAPSTSADPTASVASRVPQKVLGQSDFLKLLSVQFQAQDPMKPMEDTAFIAQMAQFSALQNSTTMEQDIVQLRADQQRVVANSYLGHRVTVSNTDGSIATGDVSAVQMADGAPQLVIGGASYPLSAVLLVEPPALSTPATPAGAQ